MLCRALSGLCASTWAVYMICFGSLFSEEEQLRALGIASSAMFGGQVPATFLGGVIAQLWGERATFLVAVGAAALGMLFMTRAEQPRSTRTQWLSAQDFWQLLKNRDLDFDAKEKSESFQSKKFGFLFWWELLDSNQRPLACEASALPAELSPQVVEIRGFEPLTF